jgi:AcrR family transcriptional regulator
MSKSVVNRREKILDKALETFNEQGIEYVGLRELAAMINMRVSNITYYFPTKDDLVHELSLQLSKSNAAIIVTKENLSMKDFLQMLHNVFQNHLKYRCLLLSVVHLMKQNKHMAAAYKKTQDIRNSTIRSNLEILMDGGYLNIADENEMEFLVTMLSLVSRFWISESALSNRQAGVEKQLHHYLKLVTKLLFSYATSKAKKQMNEFLKQIL